MDKQVNESELEPKEEIQELVRRSRDCLLYTSPSPRD